MTIPEHHPDNADRVNYLLDRVTDDVRPALEAIYCFPNNVPVLVGRRTEMYGVHLAIALINGDLEPDELLHLLNACDLVCPTLTGEPA